MLSPRHRSPLTQTVGGDWLTRGIEASYKVDLLLVTATVRVRGCPGESTIYILNLYHHARQTVTVGAGLDRIDLINWRG
jgi:hypothetical protein